MYNVLSANRDFWRMKEYMIIDDVRYTMEYIEEISQTLGDIIPSSAYYIEDAGCPHKQSSLPKGYAAIYLFAYGSETEYEYLKIGKANANSDARFTSQHYGFSTPSTLAKSICADNEFRQMGINRENVKEWMLNHLHRINIFIRAEQGKPATELIEAIFHYKFRPRYEGNL